MPPADTDAHELVASLFASLAAAKPASPALGPEAETGGFAAALEQAGLKPVLITLHCLFPQSFLPALDILDRRLALRFGDDGVTTADEPASRNAAYYVRASPRRAVRLRSGARTSDDAESGDADPDRVKDRDYNDDDAVFYEVRLGAWNCTCAAFAFAALAGGDAASMQDDSGDKSRARGTRELHGQEAGVQRVTRTLFGGARCRDGGGVPTCKHILACFLLETWPMVADACEIVAGGPDDRTGWAAAWK